MSAAIFADFQTESQTQDKKKKGTLEQLATGDLSLSGLFQNVMAWGSVSTGLDNYQESIRRAAEISVYNAMSLSEKDLESQFKSLIDQMKNLENGGANMRHSSTVSWQEVKAYLDTLTDDEKTALVKKRGQIQAEKSLNSAPSLATLEA